MISPEDFGVSPSETAEKMIFIIDVITRKIEYASPMSHYNLGFGKNELMELRVDDLHPMEMHEMMDFMLSINKDEESTTDSLHCMAKNGKVLPAIISGRIRSFQDQNYLIARVKLKE